MECKLKVFHGRWNTTCRAGCSPVEARRESGCHRWSLVAGRLRFCFALLLTWDFVLHNLFQSSLLSVNALCLCSAVNGILPWPQKMRDWIGTVAFSCFHPFGGEGELSLKSQRGWHLCRDTSGLTRTARGQRRACGAVRWSLHLQMTAVWSWGSGDGPKPLDKSSSQGMHPSRTEMMSGSAAWLVGSWIK